jgi:hypothetical protein
MIRYDNSGVNNGVKAFLDNKKQGLKNPVVIINLGAGNRNRTGMGFDTRRILSPVRLPVPPPRQN